MDASMVMLFSYLIVAAGVIKKLCTSQNPVFKYVSSRHRKIKRNSIRHNKLITLYFPP